tara:strand:- start:294 stop:1115 length:822 start_codon:yes stop_codon:yes gene_type:complete
MNVPPRKGQRNKSIILKPFNNGRPFKLVEIKNKNQFGIIDESSSCETGFCNVWVEHDIISQKIPINALLSLNFPVPNNQAFEEEYVTIGGIGKHIRWNVVMPKPNYNLEVKLLVTNINCVQKFKSFIENTIRPFGFSEYDIKNKTAFVVVPNGSNIGAVAAALHCAEYGAVPTKEEYASGGKLGIERYDRSEHMWWNQNKKEAGPLRDTHRWKYNFIPATWENIPFTWQSMATNISVSINDYKYIPLPLRNYAIENVIEKQKNLSEKRNQSNI